MGRILVFLLFLGFLPLTGCTLDLNIVEVDQKLNPILNSSPRLNLISKASSSFEAHVDDAPVFTFSSDEAISNIKLYRDPQCANEVSSEVKASELGSYSIRDLSAGEDSTTYNYYISYFHSANRYCSALGEFTFHKSHYTDLLSDISRTGLYLAFGENVSLKVLSTRPTLTINASTEDFFKAIPSVPSKLAYISSRFYVLTEDGDLFVHPYVGAVNGTPSFTGVRDIFVNSETAHSIAILFNDGTVQSQGTLSSAPVGLAGVKEIHSTRGGFVAVTTAGAVVSWATNAIWGPNTYTTVASNTNVETTLPANFPMYGLGAVALKKDGSVIYPGHGNRPGAPTAPRQARLVGKSDIKFYKGNNSLGVTYTDAGVTKGFTWTKKGDGDSTTYDAQLTDIKKLVPNYDAWVALLNSGDIVYWGLTVSGDNNLPAMGGIHSVVDVVPNNYGINHYSENPNGQAFAMLHSDGSVTSIGHTTYGGSQAAVASQINGSVAKVTKIVNTGLGFAALREDGRVFVWGECAKDVDLSQLKDIADIVSNQGVSTLTCGLVALDQHGEIYHVTHTGVTGARLLGFDVKYLLSMDESKMIYINSAGQVIQMDSKKTVLTQGVKNIFNFSTGLEFLNDNTGNFYSPYSSTLDCARNKLPGGISAFVGNECEFGVYKNGNVWSYFTDEPSYDSSLSSFVSSVSNKSLRSLQLVGGVILLALDTNGQVHHQDLSGGNLLGGLDLSSGIKGVHSDYLIPYNLVFHKTDNTLLRAGYALQAQNFAGNIDSLTDIQSVRVTPYDGFALNSAKKLFYWSIMSRPGGLGFLDDFIDAQGLYSTSTDATWILTKNNGEYYYWIPYYNTLTRLGKGKILESSLFSPVVNNHYQFIKLEDDSVAVLTGGFGFSVPQKLTYDISQKGFISICITNGTDYFAFYPDGRMQKLKVTALENF